MNRFFFVSLAWDNLKKNTRSIVPYGLTCLGSVLLYYVLCSIAQSPMLETIRGGWLMGNILQLGCTIMALFSVGFLLYTHSFTLKQRRREFGLFMILGMEKRHLLTMLCWETAMLAFMTIAGGLAGGILLDKLAQLFLLKLLQLEAVHGWSIQLNALLKTASLFFLIHLLTLAMTFIQVKGVSLISLMHQGEAGEKEP